MEADSKMAKMLEQTDKNFLSSYYKCAQQFKREHCGNEKRIRDT